MMKFSECIDKERFLCFSRLLVGERVMRGCCWEGCWLFVSLLVIFLLFVVLLFFFILVELNLVVAKEVVVKVMGWVERGMNVGLGDWLKDGDGELDRELFWLSMGINIWVSGLKLFLIFLFSFGVI